MSISSRDHPLCCLLSVSLKTPVKFPHNEMKAKEKSEEPSPAENLLLEQKLFPATPAMEQWGWDLDTRVVGWEMLTG